MKILQNMNKERVKVSTWLFAFYLILAPLDFLPVVPGVSISKILIIIPLGVSLFYIKDMKVRLDKFFIITILYIMIVMVSVMYSYDSSATIQRTISIGLNIGVILILSMLDYNQMEIRNIKKAMCLSGWLTILLMLYYADKINGRLSVTINGVSQDPNYLTGFLIFSIIYYLEAFMNKKKLSSLIKLMLFLVLVLFTGSRGGAIAILGSIFFYILCWMRSKKLKISSLLTIFVLFTAIAMFYTYIIDMLPDTIAQRYDISYTLKDGGANRWTIWKSILYNYEHSSFLHKLFGMGAGTIRYFTYGGHVGHNLWIESIMEIGLLGFTILLTFYIMFFLKAYAMKEFVVSASFVGYMIMSMSMSLYTYKPIWNIILLIMILKNRKRMLKRKVG